MDEALGLIMVANDEEKVAIEIDLGLNEQIHPERLNLPIGAQFSNRVDGVMLIPEIADDSLFVIAKRMVGQRHGAVFTGAGESFRQKGLVPISLMKDREVENGRQVG